MATTAFCVSAKQELLQAGHCFDATTTFTGNVTNASFNITNVSSFNNLAVGMALTGTGIQANTVIAAFSGTTTVVMSITGNATNTGVTVTATGDVFKILLIKVSPTRTFDGTQTNVGTPGAGAPSTSNVGTDETSGTGYNSGGTALTNVEPSVPATPGTVGTTSFSPNPSWTSASFSTTAGIIYNTSNRLGTTGRTLGVYDFGGTQTVSSGTLTILMPTNDGNNAVLRLQ